MPWTKIKGTNKYRSPSGKVWTLPMIRAYLAQKYGKGKYNKGKH